MVKYMISLGFIIFSSNLAGAACLDVTGYSPTCGPASSYEITINEVAFCKSELCPSPVIVTSVSKEFDIADSAAGSAVGSYADLDNVDAGVYTHIRTKISPSITYSAPEIVGVCADQTNTTRALSDITGLASMLTTSPNDTNFGLTYDGTNLIHIYELSAPLAISKAASLPQVQIDFATSEGYLCLDSSNMYPGAPNVSIKVINN